MTKSKNMVTIKPMTKTQLATLYLPELLPASAEKRLMIWIKEEPHLQKELAELGYKKRQKYLTKEQVEAVFNWLGNPDPPKEVSRFPVIITARR